MRARSRGAVCAAVVVLVLAACGGTGAQKDKTLNVYAAASLQAPFAEIASEFEASRPGVSVQLNHAGSSDLATQIIAGAPADVFASADEVTMERVAAEGLLAAGPRTFTTNVLTIAVAAGNPLGIDSLESLADPGIAVVLCAPQVPCGAAAVKAEQAAGVSIDPVSEENSVADVLGKVSSGQADAGLVYATDVEAARGRVDGVAFDVAGQTRNVYPIAGTEMGGDLAAEFVDLVAGPRGQAVLSSHGFGELNR